MKLLSIICLFIAGFNIVATAQVQTLPGITLMSRNYKYLRALDNKEVAQPVQLLEHQAAVYNVKESEYYQDDYDAYYVSFYLPKGYILAIYDSTGKLLSTAEKFKNVAVPSAVKTTVAERFPNWAISKNIYLVNYEDAKGAKKVYKLVLENSSKRIRVKINEKGEILD